MSRLAVVVAPVVPYPPNDGGRKRTLRLLEAMARAGARPHLVSADAGNAEGAQALRARGWGVDVVEEPEPSLARRASQHLRRLPSPYLPGLRSRLAELAAEAAFLQVEHTQAAYYLDALGTTPTVLSLHNVDSQMLGTVARAQRPLSVAWLAAWNRALAMGTVERRVVGRVDAVLCVSERDAAELAGRARRVVLVPNGVDDEFFDVPARLPDEEQLTFFGQFDYLPNSLGVERFLREGWPELARLRPAARLRLLGRGMSPALERLVAEGERVEAAGYVDDLPRELARARLSLVPLWQGGGTRLKVLESLAAARPVVGTPLGVEGVGFEDGGHGRVGETPQELARAAAALLRERVAAERMGAAGRAHVERYRWAGVTEPAEQLYRGWLA